MNQVLVAQPTVEAAPIVRPIGLPAWRAAILVFVASCATLVLELIAGRLLAPFIGSSLHTWTSIIGVVLAGISLGNWYGGKVADRTASRRLVGTLFLVGALSALAIIAILAALGDGAVLRPVPLLPRIFLLTMATFFVPSFLLGMVTPVIIRLALPDVTHTGRVVGMVYAVGTLGSLAGNFLTGFVLVAHLAVTVIVVAVAAVLVVFALLAGEWWRRYPALRSVEAGPAGAPETGGGPAAAVHRGWFSLPGNVALACGVVVVASFCTMAIELAASRVLAPYVGVSLYSWTGIIGVVLAGITLGNYVGGWIADRAPRQRVLGSFLFLGGLTSLSILYTVRLVTESGTFNSLGLMERIVALTAAVFFVPVFFLGTISPQVIKLVVTQLSHAGRVAGRVYAWSTGGAIAGTFLTGWLLISLVGVYPLILGAGLGLVVLAVLVGRFWRSLPALAVSVGLVGGAVWFLQSNDALSSQCAMETDYFCIKVYDQVRDGGPVKVLVLDHLIHSYVKPEDPSYLGYEHEQVQAELTRWVAAGHPQPNVLLIGGGGYTYPRWVDTFVPQAKVEVVEIDPGVTEIVHREFGLPRDTRIQSHNLDGRQFVQEIAPREHYNLIVQDAVNDISVPYHIMTKEYNDQLKRIMTPDGIYLLTVIDLYRDGQLLRAAIRTMMESFPEVELLSAHPAWNSSGASVFVIYGSNKPLDLQGVAAALRQQGVDRTRTIAQPQADLRAYVATGPQIVLTDQYAPVDNLITLLFRARN